MLLWLVISSTIFLWFGGGVVHVVVASYIVDHYCLRFDRGVVHVVVVGYIVSIITV